MTEELKARLIFLADKYENATFPDADPCQFLHWYDAEKDGVANVECAAFIAAMLAFGNRKQFIPKIREILERVGEWAEQFPGNQPEGQISVLESKTPASENQFSVPECQSHAMESQCSASVAKTYALECHPSAPPPSLVSWLQVGAPNFPHGSQKFYRFYSYDDLHTLFAELAQVTRIYGSLGNAVQKIQEGNAMFCFPIEKKSKTKLVSERSERTFPLLQPAAPALDLATSLFSLFPKSAIVPKGKSSANKRIHMFLRWMVRRNSSVDLGLWTWANPADLLIPLDVHVMEESVALGLLPLTARPNHKTAVELTKKLAEVFPGDPARGDFALFGLGVDKG